MRSLFLIALLGLINIQVAAIENGQYFRINQVLAKKHILPRYDIFSQKTSELDRSARKFCTAPSKLGLQEIQKAFHSVADAWARVQHIQFGPIEEKRRLERIYFWPDKHNTGSRHFLRLIKSEDESIFIEEKFPLISVALQGLPALERLLFSQSENLFISGKISRFHCRFIQAISLNLKTIGTSILSEWIDEKNNYLNIYTSSTVPVYAGEDEIFEDHLSNLYSSLRTIYELKLNRALGDTAENSRPRMTEAWRSERSMRNIILNLESAEKLFSGEGEFGIDDIIEILKPGTSTAKDFKIYMDYTLQTAKSIDIPLHKAVLDKSQHEKVDRLKAQILALMWLVRTRILTALDMRTGFNAFDGD